MAHRPPSPPRLLRPLTFRPAPPLQLGVECGTARGTMEIPGEPQALQRETHLQVRDSEWAGGRAAPKAPHVLVATNLCPGVALHSQALLAFA